MRHCGAREQFDGFIIEHMKVFAIDARHAAMPMAHVFAKTDVGDDNQIATARGDRADRLLHDAVLVVGGACALVFVRRDSEQQHRLQAETGCALRFVGNLA